SRTPTTSTPSRTPRIVAAPITLLMPGAGPPPTRMASFFWWLKLFPLVGSISRWLEEGSWLLPQEGHEIPGELLRLLPVRRVPRAGIDDEPRAADGSEEGVLVRPCHHPVLVAPHEQRRHLDLLERHAGPGCREARGDLVPDAGGGLLHLSDHRLEERGGAGAHGGAALESAGERGVDRVFDAGEQRAHLGNHRGVARPARRRAHEHEPANSAGLL